MAEKRLFSRDPVLGLTEWWHYDDDNDRVTIETTQDIEPALEVAQDARNAQTRLDRWGDGKHVGFIPMAVYAEWLRTGKQHDQAFVRRWLNDPENKKYRTFQGKV